MYGIPYIVDYWPDRESLESDNNHETHERMIVAAHSEHEAIAAFQEMNIPHVHAYALEPVLR